MSFDDPLYLAEQVDKLTFYVTIHRNGCTRKFRDAVE